MAAGFKRKTITTCSKWAQKYRVMGQPYPGPFQFVHHPWSLGIHDCKAEKTIGQKAAQMAYTETALNRCFFAIDIHGYSVLYILPSSKPDASDFSTSRFDPALELSPHLREMFSSVKNIGHKRAGAANLFIRGSRSRSQLKSIPVAVIIFDEVDEMVQDNITLAEERTSGQTHIEMFLLSTPTVEETGINIYFLDSTQNHYVFKCPHCGRYTELLPDESLIITAEDKNDPSIKNSHYICKECKHVLNHNTKREWLKERAMGGTAHWEPMFANMEAEGFWIPQLYSMARIAEPPRLARYILEAKENPTKEQELHNSKYGLPHTVKGAKVTDAMIRSCTGGYKELAYYNGANPITMGVDVGKLLHVEICEWFRVGSGVDLNSSFKPKVIFEGTLKDFEQLDDLVIRYGVNYCVVDHQPETREATKFANRFFGRVKLCHYHHGIFTKDMNVHADSCMITVGRTPWMDTGIGRLKNKDIILPIDLSHEYKTHIKAPIRVYKEDNDGNPVGVYITSQDKNTKAKRPDHFAHARVYSEIALPLAVSLAQSQTVTETY